VRALGDEVRAAVSERFGIDLAYEIEFVGEWGAAGGDGSP
jgi:UDP-N-acetylenolpyruvoylglucosamine reductase